MSRPFLLPAALVALGATAMLAVGCTSTQGQPVEAPAAISAPAVRAAALPAMPAVPDIQPVSRVIDGDTFETPEGKVRVLVMDSCEKGTAGGTRATAEAKRLLPVGTQVILGVEAGHDRDRYGRLLRYVTLPDGRDYADTMLEATHTAVYAGRADASPGKVAEGRKHDKNGRTCDAHSNAQPSKAKRTTSSAPRTTSPRTTTRAVPDDRETNKHDYTDDPRSNAEINTEAQGGTVTYCAPTGC